MKELTAKERAYFDSPTYFKDVITDIEHSQHSIDVEMYIMSGENIGQKVLSALIDAASRGVKVRLLVDGIGSIFWLREIANSNVQLGPIELRVYNPMRWLWPLPRLLRFNRRNHRKLFLIDDNILYTGSLNLNVDVGSWRETGLRLESADTHLVKKIFEYTWMRAGSGFTPLHYQQKKQLLELLKKSLYLRCNQFLIMRFRWRKELVKRIEQADKQVWLTTSYFVPPPSLLRAMKRSAKRGVDVCLLLPHFSDVPLMHLLSQFFYPALLKSGVKIFEYNKQFLHAKSYIIDDWVSIGSTNLDYRSFMSNLEMDVVLSQPQSIADAKAQFLKDIEGSLSIQKPSYGFFRYFLAQFLMLFRRLL